MQHLMHQFKYKGNKDLGLAIGKNDGRQSLKNQADFMIDALIPLPFFQSKKKEEDITRQLFYVKEWQKVCRFLF